MNRNGNKGRNAVVIKKGVLVGLGFSLLAVTIGSSIGFGFLGNELSRESEELESSEMVKVNLKERKAIVVAGQSNTIGTGFITDAVTPSGELNTRIKYLGRSTASNLVLTQAGLSNIEYQNSEANTVGYGYTLATEMIKDMDSNDELIIIPVARNGNGWIDSKWSADGDLQKDLQARIRYVVDNLGAEIIGAFWSQGERDTIAPYSTVYDSLLYGMVQTIRDVAELSGQKEAQKIPFVTFDMVSNWVGSDPNRLSVQNALEKIGENVPYTANVDTEGLSPPLENYTDLIHYDTRQQIELGKKMKEAWVVAKSNDKNIPETNFQKTLIYKQTYGTGNILSDKYLALKFGNNENDSIYSILGDLWKYRKNGKYKLRIEFKANNQDRHIEWEQAYLPYFVIPTTSPASIVSINTEFGSGGRSGFSGLTYFSGDAAFLTLSTASQTWFTPIGMSGNFNGGIPIYANSTTTITTNEIKLYVL